MTKPLLSLDILLSFPVKVIEQLMARSGIDLKIAKLWKTYYNQKRYRDDGPDDRHGPDDSRDPDMSKRNTDIESRKNSDNDSRQVYKAEIFAGLLLQTPSLHDLELRDMFVFIFSPEVIKTPRTAHTWPAIVLSYFEVSKVSLELLC
ncbi:hypothetical protein Tco_0567813 [Tanacetum coccineum]